MREVLNYFSQVSEEEFPDKPELRPVRRMLLEAALGYYKDFIEQQSDDPSIQAEMTASKLRIASLLEEMGQQEDALAIYEQLRTDIPATPGLPGGFRWLGESEFALSSLLTQPAVQQDLKLTDEQIKAIALHAERRREPAGALIRRRLGGAGQGLFRGVAAGAGPAAAPDRLAAARRPHVHRGRRGRRPGVDPGRGANASARSRRIGAGLSGGTSANTPTISGKASATGCWAC